MTPPKPRAAWTVFTAVSLMFFFLNGATFTSLGVVLWTMMAELHWTNAEAGFSFSLLGIACGICSPLPAWMMKRFGGRWTIVAGAVALAIGFFLAAASHSLAAFYVAMLLLGLGYALGANVPGVYLLAAWFPRNPSRIIGLYLMFGAFGATAGPPVVHAIVAGTGGWRGHWQAMAWTSVVLAVWCAAFVRDIATPAVAIDGVKPIEAVALASASASGAAGAAAADTPTDAAASTADLGWSTREASATSQFMWVAAAMTVTTACITTNSSVMVGHLVHLGATAGFAAVILSLLALVATLAKGVAGRLGELMSVPHLLAYGLLAQAVGNLLIGMADQQTLQYAAALVYGIGWGVSYVAATVVLLDYFGRDTGSQVLSFVWLLTTVAAAGPVVAGRIADTTGSFSPIFYVYAGLLFALAVPVFLMRPPVRRGRAPFRTSRPPSRSPAVEQ